MLMATIVFSNGYSPNIYENHYFINGIGWFFIMNKINKKFRKLVQDKEFQLTLFEFKTKGVPLGFPASLPKKAKPFK